MIDIHSHVLPGVDDGAVDEQMTREMFARAADAGITTSVCTPHVYHIEDQLRNRKAVPVAGTLACESGLKLLSGCELNYRVWAKLSPEELDLRQFCIGSTSCILLEFSNDYLIPSWEPMLSEIVAKGFLPIIAHPERYLYIQKDIAIAEAMCTLGCELQLDAGGLLASRFGAERKTARTLLSQGMASYIASDAHRPKDYDKFAKAYKMFHEEWPEEDNRLITELSRVSDRTAANAHCLKDFNESEKANEMIREELSLQDSLAAGTTPRRRRRAQYLNIECNEDRER